MASEANLNSRSSVSDWRRVVGSLRHRVRPRQQSPEKSSLPDEIRASNTLHSISYDPQNSPKNEHDFLRAAMRIFLVVSPPMGRMQVST